MRTKQRLLDCAALRGLRRLTDANPNSQCPLDQGARSAVLSSRGLDGLANLSVGLLHFVCRYGRCAPVPLPCLLLAICSSIAVGILGAARAKGKLMRNQDMTGVARSERVGFTKKVTRRNSQKRCLLVVALAAISALLVTAAIAQAPRSGGSASLEPWRDGGLITPIPQPPRADARKLALGESLFGDTRLSSNERLSCATCHDIAKNGAYSIQNQSEGAEHLDIPTLFNAALSYRLTWEGNIRSLSEQAKASIADPSGMHSSIEEVIPKLRADKTLTEAFRAIYGHPIDGESVLDALVTFEESLLTPDSRFDRWLQGEATALTATELEGYHTFNALGCSSCHQGVNVGANLITRQGIFAPLVLSGPKQVRVPSLRNVEATAPYFHDGSVPTLEEAVRRMAAAQLDRILTDEQVASVVAFLKTLTGNYRGRPVAKSGP
jgi:cytochrome c peroxidase